MERNNLIQEAETLRIQEAERVRLKELLKREADAGNKQAAAMLLKLDGITEKDGIVIYKGRRIDLSVYTDKDLDLLAYSKLGDGAGIIILTNENKYHHYAE